MQRKKRDPLSLYDATLVIKNDDFSTEYSSIKHSTAKAIAERMLEECESQEGKSLIKETLVILKEDIFPCGGWDIIL